MKNKRLFTPPHKITALFLSGVLVLSCSSCSGVQSSLASEAQQQTEVPHFSAGSQEDLSATEQNLVSISSGSVYDSVTSLDQDLTLQESDSCLYVTRDIASSESNADIRRFFWDLLHVVQISDIWDSYSSMSFTFMSGDNLANIGISGFSGLTSFNATHINVIQDQELSKLFEQFYTDILGARDLSIVQEKKLYEMAQEYGTPGYTLPTEYRAGYLWTIGCFPYGTGYTVNDSAISVQVPTQDTQKCGASAVQELNSALDVFNQLCNNDPLAMPYEKVSVQYLDSQSSTTLWDWCSEKSGTSWQTTKNSCGSPSFYGGLKSSSK